MKTHALSAACAIAVAIGVTACGQDAPAPAATTTPTAATPAPATPVAQPLKTEVYNPGANGIFPVSSTLVTGAKDAVLIDAQFSTVDAQKLVDMIKAWASA